MQALETFNLIERISAILRSEERRKYAAIGLQPVHGQVLNYLAICNKYSNTHAAVADYLGLTKGTVSQTIQILERKAYLEKNTDPLDGRVVHLSLTLAGRQLIQELQPLALFRTVEARLEGQAFASIDQALEATLALLQQVNQSRSYGVCRSCSHFAVAENHFQCGLTQELLDRHETDSICREHQPSFP